MTRCRKLPNETPTIPRRPPAQVPRRSEPSRRHEDTQDLRPGIPSQWGSPQPRQSPRGKKVFHRTTAPTEGPQALDDGLPPNPIPWTGLDGSSTLSQGHRRNGEALRLPHPDVSPPTRGYSQALGRALEAAVLGAPTSRAARSAGARPRHGPRHEPLRRSSLVERTTALPRSHRPPPAPAARFHPRPLPARGFDRGAHAQADIQ
jgi:hypothetical protein